MGIKVQFNNCLRWSTHTIGEDRLKGCLAILKNNMKTPERKKLCSGLKKQLIISDYYIRGTNKGMAPYVIGIKPDSECIGRFCLYEIKYDANKDKVYLFNTGEWQYKPYMGSKKKGWRIIDLKDIMMYISVVVTNVEVSEIVYEKLGMT